MNTFPIEQAIYRRRDAERPMLVARSSGFGDAWLEEAEWLVTGFGDRPAGVRCPRAVFAQPLGKDIVAVVQVIDGDDERTSLFQVLALPRAIYESHFGDPFIIADRFPPPWSTSEPLPTTLWSGGPPAPRTVEEVQRVLKRVKASKLEDDEDPERMPERTIENSESPALLGGAQVLVDGGRLVFKRPAPDTELIRGLWTLLPTTTRNKLWPASFAFSNALGFDAVVVPRIYGEDYQGYLTEEQAADYPPGRYEFNLQSAAEAGDQRELDALLGRRSLADTKRLGLALLVLVTFLAVVLPMLQAPPAPSPAPRPSPHKPAAAAGMIGVGDPWMAIGMVEAGNRLWSKPRE